MKTLLAPNRKKNRKKNKNLLIKYDSDSFLDKPYLRFLHDWRVAYPTKNLSVPI